MRTPRGLEVLRTLLESAITLKHVYYTQSVTNDQVLGGDFTRGDVYKWQSCCGTFAN